MSDKKLKRLVTNNYKRPDKTYQDTLQNKKSMLEKLENYERVDDIEDVALKTHVRYVTLHNESKQQVFRLGGLLEEIHPKYVKLSNGEYSWSVQRYHYSEETAQEEPIFETAFWRIISKEDLLYKKIEDQHQIIQDLKQRINDLQNSNI
tara:strand:+ start:47 stop:493 length:447 start_codon:yes stop_codon:yes gene_type:complete